MPKKERHRYASLEEALDDARRMLADKFGEPDQCAAVELAQVLYTMQERERFETRGADASEPVPYRA